MTIQEGYFINNSVYLSICGKRLYRLHKSQAAGHLGIKATNQEFRNRFCYPRFTEHFICFIINCLNCLQLNGVPKNHITSKLQTVSSLQSYPEDMLQTDFVGPLMSTHFKCILKIPVHSPISKRIC